MKEIIDAAKEFAIWFLTVVKPNCEAVMEHPLFKIFAIPAAIIAAIKGVKALWNHLNDYQ